MKEMQGKFSLIFFLSFFDILMISQNKVLYNSANLQCFNYNFLCKEGCINQYVLQNQRYSQVCSLISTSSVLLKCLKDLLRQAAGSRYLPSPQRRDRRKVWNVYTYILFVFSLSCSLSLSSEHTRPRLFPDYLSLTEG